MTRAVVVALVAVVLGLTANPASADPIHDKGGKVRPACARMVITDDHPCTTPTYCQRGHHGRGRRGLVVHEDGHICLPVLRHRHHHRHMHRSGLRSVA